MNASTESPLQQTPELLRRLVDAKVELVVIASELQAVRDERNRKG